MYTSLSDLILFLEKNSSVTKAQLQSFGLMDKWIDRHRILGILNPIGRGEFQVSTDKLRQHYSTHIATEYGVWHRHTQSFTPKAGISEQIWKSWLTTRLDSIAARDHLLVKEISILPGNRYNIAFYPARCHHVNSELMHVVFDSVDRTADELQQLAKASAAHGKWELSAYYSSLQNTRSLNPAKEVLTYLNHRADIGPSVPVMISEGHVGIDPMPREGKLYDQKFSGSLAHFGREEEILFNSKQRTISVPEAFFKANRSVATARFLETCHRVLDISKVRSVTFKHLSPALGVALTTVNIVSAQDKMQAIQDELAGIIGFMGGASVAAGIAGPAAPTLPGAVFIILGGMIGSVGVESLMPKPTSTLTSRTESKPPLFGDQYPHMRVRYVENRDPSAALSANFPTFRHFKYAVLEDGTLAMSPYGTQRDIARGKPVLAAGELNLLGNRIYVNTDTTDYNVVMTDQLRRFLIEKIKFHAEHHDVTDIILCTDTHAKKVAFIVKKLSIAMAAFKRESIDKSISFYQLLSDSFLEKKYIDLTSQIKILDSDEGRFSRVIAAMKSLRNEFLSLNPDLDEYDLNLYTVDSCITDMEKHRVAIQAAAGVARIEQKNICAVKASAEAALLEAKVRAEFAKPYAVLIERKQKELESAETVLASRRKLERIIEAKKTELAIAELEQKKANQRVIETTAAAKKADEKLIEAMATAKIARDKETDYEKVTRLFNAAAERPLQSAKKLDQVMAAAQEREKERNERLFDRIHASELLSGYKLSIAPYLIKENPTINSAEEWYAFGMRYFKGKKEERHFSIDCFELAIAHDPKHRDALSQLGLIFGYGLFGCNRKPEVSDAYFKKAAAEGQLFAKDMLSRNPIASDSHDDARRRALARSHRCHEIVNAINHGQFDLHDHNDCRDARDSSHGNDNHRDSRGEHAGSWGARGGSDMWGGDRGHSGGHGNSNGSSGGGSRSGNSGGYYSNSNGRSNAGRDGDQVGNYTYTGSDRSGDHYTMIDGSGNFTLSGTVNDSDRSYSGYDGNTKCHQVSNNDGLFSYRCDDGMNVRAYDNRGSSVGHNGWDSDRGCFSTPDPWR